MIIVLRTFPFNLRANMCFVGKEREKFFVIANNELAQFELIIVSCGKLISILQLNVG